MQMKKVVIIGSGIGGIGLAALLQKSGGFDVTVLERNPYIGGKAAAYERDGFKCDMGVHYCALGDKGPLKKLANKVGAKVTFIKKSPFMRLHESDRAYNFPANFINPLSWLKMARLTHVKPKDIIGAIRLLLKILSVKGEKEASPYDEIPLSEFLAGYIKDEDLLKLIEIFCGMLLVLPAEEASAGEFLYCFSALGRTGGLCYPKGTFHAIPIAYQKVFEENGGKVHLKESVKSIRIKNKKAIGVETDKGFFKADIVISNAGIKRTVELAGENNFSKKYVKRVKSLKPSAGCVTLKYGLDKMPYDIPLYMYCSNSDNFAAFKLDIINGIVPEKPHMFMPIITASDPDLAPAGKHILIAGSGLPEGLENKEAGEQLLDNMEKTLAELFPGFNDHVIWKHRTNLDYITRMSGRTTGDVIGLGQTFDQVGKNKPDPKTPVNGLWLVGCDAGGRGVGTEQAAHSAMNVAKMIRASEK